MTNEQLLSQIDSLLDKKLDDKLDQKLMPIHNRLDNVDNRLDGIDDRFNGVDEEFISLDLRLTKIELTQENKILPALKELTVLYSSTFKIYEEKAEKINKLENDVEVLKQITSEHSKILQKIS